MRDTLSETGKRGLRLLEDLTASAAGGSVCVNSTILILVLFLFSSLVSLKDFTELIVVFMLLQAAWLHVASLPRTFSLELIE